jgi:hypothetical protein
MKNRISIVVGSILGALTLHAVLTACGVKAPAAISDAGAAGGATSASTCSAWNTAYYFYDVPAAGVNAFPLSQIVGSTAMPAGWEPIGMSAGEGAVTGNVGVLVALRQCTSP